MTLTASDTAYTTVNAKEFAKDIKADDVYAVDVRTAEEFADGHIAGAHNLDVNDENFVNLALARLPKDKIIAVNCGTGKRSAKAAAELTEAGFRVLNLDGGLTAWEAAGLPIVK